MADALSDVPVMNPPPVTAFSNYDRFEFRDFVLATTTEPHEKPIMKIREFVGQVIKPRVEAWNGIPIKSEPPKVLLVEPVIERLKFVGGVTRFFAGQIFGASYVVIRVKFTDAETRTVIAEPVFAAKAGAFAGIFGTPDNAMCADIVKKMDEYLTGNFAAAVGGKSGV
jgi:hypothetical protein